MIYPCNIFSFSRFSFFVVVFFELYCHLPKAISLLIWYIPKHLFTSMSVNVADIYLKLLNIATLV